MRPIRILAALLVLVLAAAAGATVPTTSSSSGPYTCTGSGTAFAVTFPFLERGHLVVTREDLQGHVATLQVTTDYTVAGAGGQSGTVTLTSSGKCPAGWRLTITRKVPKTQTTAFAGGQFSPKIHETALDRLAMQVQELDRDKFSQDSALPMVESAMQSIASGGPAVAPQTWNLVGDGVSTGFPIAGATLTAPELYVVTMDGVVQTPVADYLVTTGMLSFTSAPPLGAELRVRAVGYAKAASVGDTALVLAAGSITPRSLAARFSDVVNVKDFGAVGDGVTNDTVALRAADASAASSKVPLYFPAGTYRYVAPGTTYTALALSWIGSGQGNVYDANNNGATIIRCEGANGGNAFFKPPLDMQGMHFDGVDKTGVGIQLGQEGSFTGFQRWRNWTVRRFATGVLGFNFYQVRWENFVVESNAEGIRITPTDGPGDDGYFTETLWQNGYIRLNTTYGLNVYTPLGIKTWTWDNVTVENNATSGTYQAFIRNGGFSGRGVYFEGTSTAPALKLQSGSITISHGLFNGTGGIDGTSNSVNLHFDRVSMLTATDVIANVPPGAALSFRNSSLKTDLRATVSNIQATNTDIGSAYYFALVNSQHEDTGTAAPGTGTWRAGDRRWNTAPAAGGAPGWVCVTGGTPGTWKPMANLGP